AIVPERDAVETFALDRGRAVEGRCFVGRGSAEAAQLYVLLRGIESRKPGTLPLARDGKTLITAVGTDASGRFRIPYLAIGDHVFEVHLPGGRIVETEPLRIPARRPSESPDATVALPDIRFDAGATLNVVVTDDTGLPVQHASVGVLQKRAGDDMPRVIEAEADEKSRVTLTGLDVVSPAELSCTAAGFVRGSHHLETLPATATCVVTRFAKLVAHVEDDEHRKPIANAVLSIAGRELARSGSDGDFVVRSIAAGSYDVTIAAPGFAPHTEHITLRPGSTESLDTVRLRAGREV